MRKRIITPTPSTNAALVDEAWLDLDALAEVEVTSEDAAHPVESALLRGCDAGWRAATPGKQVIRLLFHDAQRVWRIFVKLIKPHLQSA